MLYVKIMSGEDLPDTDVRKHYSIIPVEKDQVMQFVDNPDSFRYAGIQSDKPLPIVPRYNLIINNPDGSDEVHTLCGNAYVMNENGKTIATHGC